MNTEKYYLTGIDGLYLEYASFKELIIFLSYQGVYRVGNSFNDTYIKYIDDCTTERWTVDFVILDYLFRVVQSCELKKSVGVYRYEKKLLRQKRYIARSWWRSLHGKNYLGFRNGPVPFSGSRYKYRNVLRYPKTKQELVENTCNEKFSRKKRGKRYLPTSWNDLVRSNCCTKSWKNKKVRKQWQKNER